MSDDTRKRFGFLKVIAIVVVVLVAIVAALPFIINANQFKPQLQSQLSSALGRDVKVGNLKLSILSGSVAVEDISIADNPSFSGSPFVNAKSLNVSVELKPLIFSKSIRISGIALDHPSITLIQSNSGTWNFSDLASGKTAGQPTDSKESGSFSGKEVLVKELKITDGQVTIVHQGQSRKPSIYNEVNITANNLSRTTAFPFSISASMPGKGTLKVEGKAGPLNDHDMMLTPMTAELAVKDFNLVASGFVEPGSGLGGILNFSGTMNSDGRQVVSKGKASVDKLQVVKSGAPAGKPVELQYAVTYNLQQRNGNLGDTSIGSGKAMAHLNGTYEIRGTDILMKMQLRGTDMPVQDLQALLPALGIALPKGASLQGGSLNAKLTAEGPVDRIVTSGTAEINKTRLVGFDLSGKMAALSSLVGLRSSRDTEIDKFASTMRMAPEGIQVSSLQLIMPAIGELSGDGRIAADQSLDFTMQAMLKPAGTLGTGLSRLVKGGALNLPFFVRGTASDPKFVPNMKKAAGGLLGSALGQGSDKGQTDTGKALGDTLRGLFQKKK